MNDEMNDEMSDMEMAHGCGTALRGNCRQTMLLLPVLLIAIMCLCGCTSLVFPKSAAPRYTLAPVPAAGFQQETGTAKTDVTQVRLIIEDPIIEAALNTTGIAISDAPLNYKYLKGVKWSDRAPRLFGLFLRRSFQNSGLFSVIGDRTTVPVGDYILYSDLRSFHVEQRRNSMVAIVEIHVRVTKADNSPLGSQLISVRQEIAGAARRNIVATFDEAANEVGTKAIDWVYGAILSSAGTDEPDTDVLDATPAL